ncbi:uncharacterized protein LOC117088149 [Trachypithecus francoisi]|uniref:uncharacterized protein LOC117088149 n=1 Tax=Trachypithecus francoisi TaxID=54180 RepID=UPI00141BC2AD|nr:uncharacterized protein LOC117088149 [Trachypithecus francoisi]XP_033075115.1 uncharacterized protein LOC117088149 [Trachypithecus francoisi]XP_033075119.1 uncharacterized protein LOC117088149 [Trachypithecus francoisi]
MVSWGYEHMLPMPDSNTGSSFENKGPLKTLPKCDITLEKLKNDVAVQHLCQQLLDAILANIHSPVFSHSLRIHFSHDCHPRPTHHVHPAGLGFVEGSWPALGHMCPVWSPCCLLKAPVVCTQKHRLEDDQRQSTPSVLQGEVARLDPKCMINLVDSSHCSNNGTVHLMCTLGECPGASGWRWLANLDRSPRPLPFELEGTVSRPHPVFMLRQAVCPVFTYTEPRTDWPCLCPHCQSPRTLTSATQIQLCLPVALGRWWAGPVGTHQCRALRASGLEI